MEERRGRQDRSRVPSDPPRWEGVGGGNATWCTHACGGLQPFSAVESPALRLCASVVPVPIRICSHPGMGILKLALTLVNRKKSSCCRTRVGFSRVVGLSWYPRHFEYHGTHGTLPLCGRVCCISHVSPVCCIIASNVHSLSVSSRCTFFGTSFKCIRRCIFQDFKCILRSIFQVHT